MIRSFSLCALLALGACATPREQCESDAAAPYRAALSEQADNARDLARGYVFKTRFEERVRRRACPIPGGGFYPCFERDLQPVTRKAPNDAPALRARQAELARILPQLRKTAGRDVAQCRALYPVEEAG